MLKQVLDTLEILDSPQASGQAVAQALTAAAPEASAQGIVAVSVQPVGTDKGSTDFVKVTIKGTDGKAAGGSARTLGVIGRLGGLGARPTRIGFTSDGDGAASAIATAWKLVRMAELGDRLPGDVIVATHVCPDAPTRPHKPVEFMDSPVDMGIMNRHEVDEAMDAILSIDTTKGNKLVNVKGISITPAILDGYVMAVPDDLLDVLEIATGRPAVTFPITNQDITPYGNGVHHVNSIVQPATAAEVPVVGVAITTESLVPGSATGASHEIDIADAVRFAIEVAKGFGKGDVHFVKDDEVAILQRLYGSLGHLYKEA
ncbi:DUF1177 domain-containing protein [Brevibacterium sp. 50QC2O2]|uniref:DUF1177 domain-containing protein n=1 Tax=Brevibacterium TaxID=1696 RepID=UPI00211C53FE|nr:MULTISPECIES: DUF1177 domain-containing protein [unclassified Brevibacterium]MCQ9367068.1 DUF1177 domain-containing protein [Brevibacterium sp. 91QC2O2]MCQ9385490.1 DUF1177 domain-containing protein [Brevibacterium sp. 68QC2CO]MCQ9388250.1 DUF1177 domain-containing protein [Brevibacterium sp. 50QC2O2]